MINLINNISNKKLVKDFGITEAFFLNGEFYTTSEYDLSSEIVESLEAELSEFNV